MTIIMNAKEDLILNSEKIEKMRWYKNFLFYIMIFCVACLLIFRNLELATLADVAYAIAPIAGICVITLNIMIRKEIKK